MYLTSDLIITKSRRFEKFDRFRPKSQRDAIRLCYKVTLLN